MLHTRGGEAATEGSADATDLKSTGRKAVRVRPPLAPLYMEFSRKFLLKNPDMGALGTHKRSVPYVFKARHPEDY